MVSATEIATYERLVNVGSLLTRRAHEQMRRDSEFTGMQYEILIRLRNAGGGLRMNEIADRVVQSPSGLTYQVRQLVQRGYIERVREAGDDRVVIAQITEAGRLALQALRPARSAFLQTNVVDPLEPDELTELHRLLGKLQNHLRGAESGDILPEEADRLLPQTGSPSGAATVAS